MSLKLAAQHLASKGRGPDTTLVHMAPQEVAGLQALARAHGGTLTTNPDTGLPEAGFLRAILPMVAGAALGPAGLGLTAMQAGLATAALGTVATGSLKQGLMAGLGAYGGAGIGGVIGNAGSAAIEAAVPAATAPVAPVAAPVAPVTPIAPPVLPATVSTPVAPMVGGPTGTGLPQATALPPAAIDPATGFPTTAVRVPANGAYTVDPMGGLSSPAVTPPSAPVAQTYSIDPATFELCYMNQQDIISDAASTARENAARNHMNQMDIMSDARAPKEAALREAGRMGRFTKGLGAIADKPELLFNKENLKYGAAALAPVMFQEPEKRAGYTGGGPNPYAYEYDPGRQAYTPSAGSSEQAYFRPRYNMMADGGLAALAGGGASHLGDYSDGGRLLRGPGDGVSDDIPATIADKRPARLADGEFVVPARIVSELGNGSTEAGARKLYAMMDRVQKNRSKTVGKNKVAVDSRSEKLLPA